MFTGTYRERHQSAKSWGCGGKAPACFRSESWRPLIMRDLPQRHCGTSTAGEPPVAASTDEPLALTRWGVQPRSRSQFRHGYVCSFADGPVRDRTDSRGKKITGQRKNGLSKPRLQMTSSEFISSNGKRSKP